MYETVGSILVGQSALLVEEVVNALESALAEELNVHPSDIEIVYDSGTGVASYIISSDNAESLMDLIDDIQRDDFEIASDDIFIESIVPPTDIIVSIGVSVDVSGVSDADTIMDSVVETLQSQDPNFVVEGTIQFVTSAPSSAPSAKPTSVPSTSIPSGTPSISGWVATISATKTTVGPISSNEIEGYTLNIAEFYGVDASDVEVSTEYEATGSMSIIIPDDITESELTEAITSSVAESLGVHPSDVKVIVDMESGAVEFIVSSDDFNQAASASFDLSNDQFEESIVSGIESSIPTIIVEAYEADDNVLVSIQIAVDANNAVNDLTQASWQSEQLLKDFDVTANSNQFLNFSFDIFFVLIFKYDIFL